MATGRPNGFGAGSGGAPGRAWPWAIGLLALALAGPAAAGPEASPEDPTAPAAGWLSAAFLAGSTQFDAGLADYQWDTTPRFGWGFLGLVGRGRLAAGLELWRAGTTQSIGDLGAAPGVHTTRAELVGETRVVERRGTGLWMRGHGGLLHLGYQPDRITIQPPGPVSPVTVDLAPLNTWTVGAGLAVRHAMSDRWMLGLSVDTRRFAIDTAHRVGNEIVYARQTFGEWSAGCEVARTFGRR